MTTTQTHDPVTLADLRRRPAGAFLYCWTCDERYSSDAGDYFWFPEDEVFTCSQCDEKMDLCTESCRIESAILVATGRYSDGTVVL